jgi:hypothetical protein
MIADLTDERLSQDANPIGKDRFWAENRLVAFAMTLTRVG